MTARRRLLPVVALVTVFGGFADYRWTPWRESPREAWEAISGAAAAGDYGAVWDRFDPASRARMAPRLREFVPDPALTDRERFVRLCESRPDVRVQFLPGPVIDVRGSGRWARVELARPDPLDRSPVPGPTSAVVLAQHEEHWCLSYGADPPR